VEGGCEDGEVAARDAVDGESGRGLISPLPAASEAAVAESGGGDAAGSGDDGRRVAAVGSCGGDRDARESGDGGGCGRPLGAELAGGHASSFPGLLFLPRLLLLLLPTAAGTNCQEEMSEGKGDAAGGLPRLREENFYICGFFADARRVTAGDSLRPSGRAVLGRAK
jgi:hypothetical protein